MLSSGDSFSDFHERCPIGRELACLCPAPYLCPVYRAHHLQADSTHERGLCPLTSRAADNRKNENAICDGKTFGVELNLDGFLRRDINVRVVGGDLVIEGKHEERDEDDSFVTRCFMRKFRLPNSVDLDSIDTRMDDKGMLKITVNMEPNVRMIPIDVDPGYRAGHSKEVVVRKPIPMWWF